MSCFVTKAPSKENVLACGGGGGARCTFGWQWAPAAGKHYYPVNRRYFVSDSINVQCLEISDFAMLMVRQIGFCYFIWESEFCECYFPNSSGTRIKTYTIAPCHSDPTFLGWTLGNLLFCGCHFRLNLFLWARPFAFFGNPGYQQIFNIFQPHPTNAGVLLLLLVPSP